MLDAAAPTRVVDRAVTDRGGTAVWHDHSGPAVFDALHRAMLVRFPESADALARVMREGRRVRRLELVLPWRDDELWPPGGEGDYYRPDGYGYRVNFGVDRCWRALRPRWHAIAWALRRPWTADPRHGPTYNAAVAGLRFWTRHGASDTGQDRYPRAFGPVEVSAAHPEGCLDVTEVLSDPSYGPTPEARLRAMADRGFVVQKWETYDAHFYTEPYEWATACGGRGVLVRAPRLRVTFEPGPAPGALPPPASVEGAPQGQATAVMPDLATLSNSGRPQRPAWMPEWQWQRVCELRGRTPEAPFWYDLVPAGVRGRVLRTGSTDRVYEAWVDGIIGRPPRGWAGFDVAREMAQWYMLGDVLPEPARDALRRHWTAWLMPDRENAPLSRSRDASFMDGPLIHPQAEDPQLGGGPPPDPAAGRIDRYVAATDDWRGNKSFFRAGFCWWQSTQNFNTTAAAGALLGGAIIGSSRAMDDGRHGVETFALRMYAWGDGSGQEHIDHYYLPITLSGNKALADFGPTPYDRLIGQSLLAAGMEELAAAWHPALRSFIAGSSRTSLDMLLGTQDGLQCIIHTLSRRGALRDVGEGPTPLSAFSDHVPASLVALQTMRGPWAPVWMQALVEDKALPFEATFTGWRGALRRCYMGRNYGMASSEHSAGRIQAMAQWRRARKTVESMRDLGTLDIRFGTDVTRWVNDAQGWLTPRGTLSVLQHRQKMIAIASPTTTAGSSGQISLGVFSFETPSRLEIHVDGRRVDRLPFTCRQGQCITIRDGVTYIGVIPLPATDAGRDAEVRLDVGPKQPAERGSTSVAPALVIDSYVWRGHDVSSDVLEAHASFAVEMGDVDEYGGFAAFEAHMRQARGSVAFDAGRHTVNVRYESGGTVMEAASVTFSPDGSGGKRFWPNLSLRRVNGREAVLPQRVERDTPYARLGFGTVEKNGATVRVDPARKAYLIARPDADLYCAWNPLPDPTSFVLTVPKVRIASVGRVGLLRVVVRPAARTLDIDHADKPGESLGAALDVTGIDSRWRVQVDGRPVAAAARLRLDQSSGPTQSPPHPSARQR